MPEAATKTIRYFAELESINNALCNHVWFDSTPEALKAELARLKAIFEKTIKTQKGKTFLDKNGYISNALYSGRHNIDLKCGDLTANVSPVRDASLWHTAEPDTITESEWDANVDDYAIRLTAFGVYFIVESTYDEDELDESPLLPYDLIP